MSKPQPRTLTYGFYNFAPPNEGRTTATLQEDLRAIANRMPYHDKQRRPKLLGGVECIGWGALPVIHGMRLFRQGWNPRHPGRSNICLYVDNDLPVHGHGWVDLQRSWPNTEHPGMHDPRSILWADVKDWRVLVGHAPPRTKGDTSAAARGEYVREVAKLIDSTNKPTLLLQDSNALGRQIIEACDTKPLYLAGAVTDNSISTEPNEADNLEGIFGVKMRSDHHSFLFGKTVRAA
jgi:hypothetical protein